LFMASASSNTRERSSTRHDLGVSRLQTAPSLNRVHPFEKPLHVSP
jgi:hypothetical protein